METINEHRTEIMEASLNTDREEVSTTIAGYIAMKLAKRSNSEVCKKLPIANQMDLDENHIVRKDAVGGFKKCQRQSEF